MCLRTWIKILCEAGHHVSVIASFSDSKEVPFHPNCKYYSVNYKRLVPGRFRLVNDLLRSRALSIALRESGLLSVVDAVDVQECQIAPFAFPSCRKQSVKKVHSVHLSALAGQERFGKVEASIHRAFNLGAARSADSVISVSNWIKDLYVTNGLSNKKIHVVYNAIDVPQVLHTGRKDDRINFLWVGRFAASKGVNVAIEASLATVKKIPEARFNFVGEGPLFDVVRRSVAQAPKGSFNFTGHVSDVSELNRLRAESDVYFFTSVHETFGRTLAEGMASGLPCIATDHPVMREVMADTGVYFRIEDVDDLIAQMGEMAKDKVKREILGNQARVRVEQLFGEKSVSKQLLEAYETILA